MSDLRWFDEVTCQACIDPLHGPLLQAGGITVPGGEPFARKILALAAERAAVLELIRAAGCLCRLLAGDGARWADCGCCQGRGYASPSPAVACANCHGEGEVVEIHDPRCPHTLADLIEARGKE